MKASSFSANDHLQCPLCSDGIQPFWKRVDGVGTFGRSDLQEIGLCQMVEGKEAESSPNVAPQCSASWEVRVLASH